MFNLVLGSLMLRIAEVTAAYTTGGAWYTGEPDSYQDGLSPPRSSVEVASCLVLCPRLWRFLNLYSPDSTGQEETVFVTKSYWIGMCQEQFPGLGKWTGHEEDTFHGSPHKLCV